MRPAVSITFARVFALPGEANSSPPPPDTTSTSQPCSGRWLANERQRAAGPPAWSIGRWLTRRRRLTGRISSHVTETLPQTNRPARLRTDVFLTLGGKGLSLLFGLAIVVLIARELGPTRQGLFAVAFSLSLVLIHLGGLGLTSANPYFAAREPE